MPISHIHAQLALRLELESRLEGSLMHAAVFVLCFLSEANIMHACTHSTSDTRARTLTKARSSP